MSEILQRLGEVIGERRRHADPQSSYVASLHRDGLDRILRKLAEECGETLLAAKNAQSGQGSAEVVRETADLWFHCLVMLAEFELSADDVLEELARRFDISGITEKAARKTTTDLN